MRFRDSIGPPHGPKSDRGDTRFHVRRSLTDAGPAVPIKTAPAQIPARSEESTAVLWTAVLIVVAAITTAAWLGFRNSRIIIPPPSAASADSSADEEPPGKRPDAKVRRARPRAASAERPVETTGNESASAIEPASEVAPARDAEATATEATSHAAAPPIVEPPPEDNYVYSADGTGVIAPRLLSLGFPDLSAKGFATRTSTLELIISKSGTVEGARIFSAPRNWEDAMLLSRAKTFQFIPAQRNGSPVRYRVVMEIARAP